MVAVFRICIVKTVLNGLRKYWVELVDTPQHMSHHRFDGKHLSRKNSIVAPDAYRQCRSSLVVRLLSDKNSSSATSGRSRNPQAALMVIVTDLPTVTSSHGSGKNDCKTPTLGGSILV